MALSIFSSWGASITTGSDLYPGISLTTARKLANFLMSLATDKLGAFVREVYFASPGRLHKRINAKLLFGFIGITSWFCLES